MGNCLAGDHCVFSHDPAHLVSSLNLGGGAQEGDLGAHGQPSFQVQDYDAFPPTRGQRAQPLDAKPIPQRSPFRSPRLL